MSEWISITERLPDNDDYVLVATSEGVDVFVGYCDARSGVWTDACGERMLHVTHWMPLPAPPEPRP